MLCLDRRLADVWTLMALPGSSPPLDILGAAGGNAARGRRVAIALRWNA